MVNFLPIIWCICLLILCWNISFSKLPRHHWLLILSYHSSSSFLISFLPLPSFCDLQWSHSGPWSWVPAIFLWLSSTSSSDLSSEFQTHISAYLLDISSWISIIKGISNLTFPQWNSWFLASPISYSLCPNELLLIISVNGPMTHSGQKKCHSFLILFSCLILNHIRSDCETSNIAQR